MCVFPPAYSGKLKFSPSQIPRPHSAWAGDDGLGDGGSAAGTSKAELGGPDPHQLLLTPNPPPPPRSVHALCLFLPAAIKHMPVTLLPALAAMLSSFFLLSLRLRWRLLQPCCDGGSVVLLGRPSMWTLGLQQDLRLYLR